MTRVLVIEDEKDIRENIIEILNLNGFEAQGASNGERGLTLVNTVHPDLVLCDIMMEGMDGYGVLETVRSDDQMSSIPFIFLTALSSHEDLRRGMTAGADDYLTKPFDPEELVDAVNSRIMRMNSLQGTPSHLQDVLTQRVYQQFASEKKKLSPESIEALTDRIARLVGDEQLDADCRPSIDMQRATKQLTTLTRINAGALTNRQIVKSGNMVNVRNLWLHALDETRMMLGNAYPVTLITDENNTSAEVYAETDSLRSAFTELLINAHQHSVYNGIVTIAQWATRDHVWFSVTDSGRGMSSAQVKLLLSEENFERGLGLALAKRVAEVHGGDLRIDSAPNQGTIVAIRLPLAKVDTPAYT